ncbi:MAG TPA: serine/threonine-protein kinase [Streptosporangiaceae bacterium]
MTVRTGVLVAGRYRVENAIGEGGMGVVWSAYDERIGRTVALKRAKPGSDEQALRRAEREARVAGLVGHPRVVGLYDVVVEEGVCWLVMEYVPGRDLARILDEDGVRPPGAVARVGAQLAEALDAIHEKGFVHGDVAPANVLITGDGDAKLTDFGAARPLWGDATVTDSGTAPGTPPYMAPEVARGGEKIPASDVFSLGATLFAAAEGVSPLGTGENPLTFAWRSGSGRISAPSVPGPLGAALAAFLDPDPAKRPDAAEAKRSLLAAAEAAGPADARGMRERALPVSYTRGRRLRRRAWVAIAAGAAALVVIAGGLIAWSVRNSAAGPAADAAAPGATRAAQVATIGEPATADPCGLMDAASLRGFGATEKVTDYGAFNRCDVLVATRSGHDDLADIEVDLDTGPWPKPGAGDKLTRTGRVEVLRVAGGDSEECDQAVLLPDHNVVYVTAKRTGDGRIGLCKAATAATGHAVTVLGRGPVPRRTAPPPPAALARTNTCGLLDDTALGRVPGIDAGHPERGFAGWDCAWNGGLSVRLRFDRNTPLTAGEDGKAARFHGRAGFVQKNGDGDHTCLVQVVYDTYTDTGGDPVDAIVYLVVEGSAKMTTLCGHAKALAGDAAARLPHG